jgi:acyl transferase domain-containing protein/acyl carrier protein
VRITGLTFRKLSSASETLLCERQWTPEPPPPVLPTPETTSRAVFVCDLPEQVVGPVSEAVTRCVYSANGESLGAAYTRAAVRLLELIQSVARPGQPATIQLVTSAVGEHALYSGLFGMLKSAQREYPSLRAQLVEVDPGAEPGLGPRLAAEAARPDAERIRYAVGSRLVARWRTATAPVAPPVPLWKARGIYLLTGGCGGIAEVLLQDLASAVSEATVIVVGRSALDAARANRLERLRRPGLHVEYRRCDVSRESDVTALLAWIEREHGTLSGIVHLAGVKEDGYVARKRADEVERVLAPKVAGTLNLDRATRHLDLELFVLFSSISAELGNAGQADYAAANGFLDAYAHRRNQLVAAGQRRGHTVSIGWPLWEAGGMQVDRRVAARLQRELGVVAMRSSEGLRALHAVGASRATQVLVLHGPRAESERVLGLTAAHDNANRASAQDTRREGGEPMGHEEIVNLLVEAAASVCSVPAAEIDLAAPLEDYGLDHLLRHRLAAELTRRKLVVPLQRCLEQTSLMDWAQVLLEQSAGGDPPPAPAASDEPLAARSLRLVRTVVARVTQLALDALDDQTSFFEYGVDSLMAVELTTQLEETFGSLPKTLFFECRNLSELSSYFAEHHAERLRPAAPPPPRIEPTRTAAPARAESAPVAAAPGSPGSLEIASVAVAGRYPRARNLAELWDNLCRGVDCITAIPKERWDHGPYFDPDRAKAGKTYSKWGGFIDGVDEFDPLFFNISPRDAEYMDPQERLFLQCAYETIEHAGYAPRGRSAAPGLGRRVGVFVGVMYLEYQLYGAQETLQGRPIALSGSASSIANRVS